MTTLLMERCVLLALLWASPVCAHGPSTLMRREASSALEIGSGGEIRRPAASMLQQDPGVLHGLKPPAVDDTPLPILQKMLARIPVGHIIALQDATGHYFLHISAAGAVSSVQMSGFAGVSDQAGFRFEVIDLSNGKETVGWLGLRNSLCNCYLQVASLHADDAGGEGAAIGLSRMETEDLAAGFANVAFNVVDSGQETVAFYGPRAQRYLRIDDVGVDAGPVEPIEQIATAEAGKRFLALDLGQLAGVDVSVTIVGLDYQALLKDPDKLILVEMALRKELASGSIDGVFPEDVRIVLEQSGCDVLLTADIRMPDGINASAFTESLSMSPSLAPDIAQAIGQIDGMANMFTERQVGVGVIRVSTPALEEIMQEPNPVNETVAHLHPANATELPKWVHAPTPAPGACEVEYCTATCEPYQHCYLVQVGESRDTNRVGCDDAPSDCATRCGACPSTVTTACPTGYTQLGSFGDDVPGCGIAGCQTMNSLENCRIFCETNPACAAFEYQSSRQQCGIYDASHANVTAQTDHLESSITCKRACESLVWGNWSACSVTCGNGTGTRSKSREGSFAASCAPETESCTAAASSHCEPQDPGCYVKHPSGCPGAQGSHAGSDHWQHDVWGELHGNATSTAPACEIRRKTDFDILCNVSDTQMLFVAPAGVLLNTDDAPSSTARFLGHTPSGGVAIPPP